MNILAVDSSGPVLSLALSARGRVFALARRSAARPHDETIFPAVRDILRRASVGLEDLDAIAAAAGPGRFTGIRIGMAYAAVTAGALKIPALSVSRLEAAALALTPGRWRAALEGPRGEIFYQDFVKAAAKRPPKPAGNPAWAEADEWPTLRARGEKRGFRVSIAPCGAREILAAAARRLARGAMGAFEPLYLKTAGYEKKRRSSGTAGGS